MYTIQSYSILLIYCTVRMLCCIRKLEGPPQCNFSAAQPVPVLGRLSPVFPVGRVCHLLGEHLVPVVPDEIALGCRSVAVGHKHFSAVAQPPVGARILAQHRRPQPSLRLEPVGFVRNVPQLILQVVLLPVEGLQIGRVRARRRRAAAGATRADMAARC
jgi:hypothetical protein